MCLAYTVYTNWFSVRMKPFAQLLHIFTSYLDANYLYSSGPKLSLQSTQIYHIGVQIIDCLCASNIL